MQNSPGHEEQAFTAFDQKSGRVPHFADFDTHDGAESRSPFSGNPPASRSGGLFLMFSLFAIGTAAGLGIAWWLMQPIVAYRSPADIDATKAIEKARDREQNPSSLSSSSSSSDTRSDIDSAELPYDGKPSSDIEGEPAAPSMDQPRALEESASPSMESADMLPSPPKPVPNAPSLSGTAVKPPQKPVAKAPQQRRVTRKTPSDREIERIKQQAAEELKKKTEIQRMKEDARRNAEGTRQMADADSRKQSQNSHVNVIARCEKVSNFIRREMCKWEVCGGKWGKNGCPSYDNPAANLY